MSRFKLVSLVFLSFLLAIPAHAQAVSVFSIADCSIASLSGSSQTAVAANSQRKYLLIFNNGNANVGVNLAGGTAAIAGAGTVTLGSLASIEYNGSAVPQGAVTVIGTAAQPIVCLEGR